MKYLILSLALTFSVISGSAQWSTRSFEFDGQTRQYRLYVPPNYNANNPAKLMVVLHGLSGTMYDASMIGVSNIADTANIIILAPQALDYNSNSIFGIITAAWNSGIEVSVPGIGTYPINSNVDDVGFINAMMDSTEVQYHINTNREYVCGASMGGFMTQRFACESANRLAAVASVMGTYALALPTCTPGKILPMAHFHGTADEVVIWDGTLQMNGLALPVGISVDSLIGKWIANNNCSITPQYDTFPNFNNDSFSVEHYSYLDGNQHSLVELFKVNGGTHTWYSYDNTGNEIDYATEIWKFFNKQYAYTTSIASISSNNIKLSLHPNPTHTILKITTEENIQSYNIIDIYGKVLISAPYNSDDIDVSNLNAGTYFLGVQSVKGYKKSFKFIKI